MAPKQTHQKIINCVLFASMCFLHISISPCAWHRASRQEDAHTVFCCMETNQGGCLGRML